jgi:hypothetical protein
MWSQLRDISIRVDEDAERGTPLNVFKYYGLTHPQANANQQKTKFSSCNQPADATQFTNANR